VVHRLTPDERLRQAQAERVRLHRLSPSRPLRDADDAAAFVRERRIVTETGHAGVPVLAHAVAGRELVGSWMASPEVHRIERQARKWFEFAAERLDQLAEAGRVERIAIAPRQPWLLPAS
jgi:hypothetical protein